MPSRRAPTTCRFSRTRSSNASRGLRAEGERETQLADIIEYELGNNSVSRPVTVAYVDFETVMNTVFFDIRNGSDPAQRLEAATEELDRLLEKYR